MGRGIEGKLCPLLEVKGFLGKGSSLRKGRGWAKVCRFCPLVKIKGYCVYDKRGAISGEEIKILLGVKSTPG